MAFVALATLCLSGQSALAQNLGLGFVEPLDLQTTDTDPREFAVQIVQYLMTFLGIIAVVIVLYGGFLWMTAAGNEDRVEKGKKAIIAGAIGLVVILAAFAIVTFVINITGNALNGDF